jgi:hypothetical protein
MPSSKSPQLSPSELLKHLRMGLVSIPHHILTIQMEPWGLIKSSVQNQVVHMKLSLCLSFYLRCSLRIYIVGTTMGFLVEIVEALAPTISSLNPVEVPTVTYEYLFCPPSSDQLRPPTQ